MQVRKMHGVVLALLLVDGGLHHRQGGHQRADLHRH